MLWRGSLLPLGREAALKLPNAPHSLELTTAAQPNGSKLPRHRSVQTENAHDLSWRGSCIPRPFAGFPSPASGGKDA
ncbi:hypothetical protein C1X69_03025 [Pseudomonas sp. FW305-67]|nr:hypothetical protein C1X70_10505 [Pseudomonas sp. FW305-53]PMY86813.1 hypothetical protein C1X68_12075 [Pseudomonas sp. FW303-C2]PMY92777.1 hypothetical protein C1X67_11765 [Pseudomonas sp. FW305-62]PNA43650.1 hypothetical protein C1X71_11180 [Pseudomonas sp. FW306-2-2C-A10BC]PNA85957.1 hypothetical protein C1X66_13725 [Pseudomonas sp. MPR-R3B]PNB23824.1 hypothetical protein C1X69_03025 [Pseudomonas sp. FW305-67]